MRNAEVALHFDELADLYELDGAISYRVLAYRNAAKSIREANASIEDMTAAGRVTELAGIGKTIARQRQRLGVAAPHIAERREPLAILIGYRARRADRRARDERLERGAHGLLHLRPIGGDRRPRVFKAGRDRLRVAALFLYAFVALPALAAEEHPERTSEPPPDAPTISADVAPGWHFVGLPLVHVARLAYAARELQAAALLYDVRRLVRGGVKGRSPREYNVTRGGVRRGVHRFGARRGFRAEVRLNAADVVMAERLLNPLGEGEFGRGRLQTHLGGTPNLLGVFLLRQGFERRDGRLHPTLHRRRRRLSVFTARASFGVLVQQALDGAIPNRTLKNRRVGGADETRPGGNPTQGRNRARQVGRYG